MFKIRNANVAAALIEGRFQFIGTGSHNFGNNPLVCCAEHCAPQKRRLLGSIPVILLRAPEGVSKTAAKRLIGVAMAAEKARKRAK